MLERFLNAVPPSMCDEPSSNFMLKDGFLGAPRLFHADSTLLDQRKELIRRLEKWRRVREEKWDLVLDQPFD